MTQGKRGRRYRLPAGQKDVIVGAGAAVSRCHPAMYVI
jgi:hypothetical protein